MKTPDLQESFSDASTFASYSREQLKQFCQDIVSGIGFGSRVITEPGTTLDDLSDEDLRKLAVSLTQGI